MLIVIYIFLVEAFGCYMAGVPLTNATTQIVVSLFLLIINTGVLFVYISKRYEGYDSIVLFALLASLLIKSFLIIWDYYGANIFVLPNSHADSESYHYSARLFALYGKQVGNYDLLIGLIYKFFGIQRITAQFFNVILSFAGISLLDTVLNNLDVRKNIQNMTLVLAALLPNYLIISSILIRETLISFVICVSLYFFSRWWKNGRLLDLALSLVVSFFASYFHSGAIAITIGYAIAVVITKSNDHEGRSLNIRISSVFMTVFFIIVFMYLFTTFSDTLFKKFGALTTESIDAYIDDHDFYGSAENASSKYYAGFSGFSGLIGILINSPIRMIYFLLVPMPWSIRGLKDLLAFLGSSLFYGGTVINSLISIIRKRTEEVFRSELVVFLVIALCSAFVFAWGTDSAGTALRHREKFYFIYLTLFAVISEFRQQNNIVEENKEMPSCYLK